MKPVCFSAAHVAVIAAIAVIVLTSGCTSPSSDQPMRPPSTDTDTYILHNPDRVPPDDPATRPPRLTVGVSDPDTQLILPWFLNDIINFVNYR